MRVTMAGKIISGIYCIENIENGKKYVGQSKDINTRIKANHRSCHALNDAFDKCGKENFKTYIVEECLIEELNEREIYWIKELHSHVTENGYNITWGGSSNIMKNRKHSDESKKKMSDSNKGRKCSDETKLKMSESHKGEKHWSFGKHIPEESKEKMRKSHVGKPSSMKGKHHSDETKEKISSSTKKAMTDEVKEKLRKSHIGIVKSEETKEKLRQKGIGRKFSEETKEKISKKNKGKKSKKASSIYFGVSFYKQTNRWHVSIMENKKNINIGYFLDEIEAAKAYDKYIIENNIDRPLNFPN